MTGDFASLAASSAAIAVGDEVTLIAGIAKPFCCAYRKSFRTSSPLLRLSSWIDGRWKYVHDNTGLSR